MQQAVILLDIPIPKYIKMDVDGIEHLILKGGSEILKQVESVLVEINDEFAEQSEMSKKFLMDAGLHLHKKCLEGVVLESKQFNQWWKR